MIMLEPGGDIYAEMNRRSVPYGVNLEITAACNLDCVHCYHVRPPEAEMSTAEICALLDDLASLGSMELTITGGEPLLRGDFGDILRHAIERDGFSVKIFSNLTLLDGSIARIIARAGVRGVETTLLGPDAVLHDRLAGMAGAFERTVAGIRLLMDHSVNVSVKTVAMKENVGCLEEMYRFAASLDVAFRHDDSLFVESDGRRRPLAHRISEREVRRSDARRRRRRSRNRGSCNAAKSVASLGPAGMSIPALRFPFRLDPSARDRSRISGVILRLMSSIRSLDDSDYGVCRNCIYDIRCGGVLRWARVLPMEGFTHCRMERKTIRRFR